MKFTNKSATAQKIVLDNDHYVAESYDCSAITPGEDGVIPAGTVIPANDATAVGVLLTDVTPAENPNGTIVVHGFIDAAKMPTQPAAEAITALKMIAFKNVSSD